MRCNEIIQCGTWYRGQSSIPLRGGACRWVNLCGPPDALSLCWHTRIPLGARLCVCGIDRMYNKPRWTEEGLDLGMFWCVTTCQWEANSKSRTWSPSAGVKLTLERASEAAPLLGHQKTTSVTRQGRRGRSKGSVWVSSPSPAVMHSSIFA